MHLIMVNRITIKLQMIRDSMLTALENLKTGECLKLTR